MLLLLFFCIYKDFACCTACGISWFLLEGDSFFGNLGPKNMHPDSGHTILGEISLWRGQGSSGAVRDYWQSTQSGHHVLLKLVIAQISYHTVLVFKILMGSTREYFFQITCDLFAHIFQSFPTIAYWLQNIYNDII